MSGYAGDQIAALRRENARLLRVEQDLEALRAAGLRLVAADAALEESSEADVADEFDAAWRELKQLLGSRDEAGRAPEHETAARPIPGYCLSEQPPGIC